MKKIDNSISGPTKMTNILALIAASIIVFALALTLTSGSADTVSLDPAYDAGKVVGEGLAYALLVWIVGYFAVWKKASKSWKWASFAVVLSCSVAGAFMAG